MNLYDKLKPISEKEPSKFMDLVKEHLANLGVRRKASMLALEVLSILREKNMTQTDLAERMGVSRQQISKIVRGQENVTLETIDKLEKALGVTLILIGQQKEMEAYYDDVARLSNMTSLSEEQVSEPSKKKAKPNTKSKPRAVASKSAAAR